MTSVFAARRRADEFQTLVEETSAGGLRSEFHDDALATVRALREVPAMEPREDFVRDLRERLMAEAADALADAPAPSGPPDRRHVENAPNRERRFAAAIGAAALVGATAAAGVAAQSALPGESLYPLKRALENAEAGAPGGDEKGETLLTNASGRLDEAERLSRSGGTSDPEVISETLDTFTEQASEATTLLLNTYEDTGRPELISDVRDFTSQSIGALRTLEPLVPTESRVALVRASTALSEIDDAALRLCPSCSSVVIDPAPSLSSSSYDVLTDVIDDTPVPPAKPSKPSNPAPEPKKQPKQTEGKTSTQGESEPEKPDAPSGPPTPTEAPDTGGGTNTKTEPPRNPVKDLTDTLLGDKSTSGSTTKPTNPLDKVRKPLEDVTRDLLP